ncbi:MAG: flavodoxin family protein [Eubacteriales bacterium]
MKTLIVYYSFKGTTKKLCESLAGQGIDLYEVKEVKERSTVGAYILGGYSAMKRKPSKIKPIKINTSPYDLIIVAFPIWASSMCPAAVAAFEQLNVNNKKIVLLAVSASGKDCSEKLKPVVEGVGGKLVKIYNVKSGASVDIAEMKKG